MIMDFSKSLEAINDELKNPETTTERVQGLFTYYWEKRNGRPSLEENFYVLPIKYTYPTEINILWWSPSETRKVYFPKDKLSAAQIELLEKDMNTTYADKLADEYILWGAGRAAAIAVIPLPLADIGPLMANEAYMIYHLGEAYGYTIDKSVVTMLTGIAGGSILGKIGASFLPFLKVPIAAGVTYAVGKAAKAYFASGMTLSADALSTIFTQAREEADTIDWEKHKIDDETSVPDEQPTKPTMRIII